MKNRYIALTLLLMTLFVLNSCELLNPLLGDNKNEPILKSDITISIERSFNSIQGQHQSIEITMDNSEVPIGGFDLLITYDASALVFQSADTGQFLKDCGWAYFSSRFAIRTIDSVTIHTIRITGLASTSLTQSSCESVTDSTSNQLAVLNFLVTNDRAVSCSHVPVQFLWMDCINNMLTDVYNNQLYVSNNIYNMIDTNIVDSTQNLAHQEPYPSYTGYNNSCDTLFPDYVRKPFPLRKIDFINGGIDIVCADSIDMRGCNPGDLTGDGYSYEISDVVLYSNYFIYGLQVFTVDLDCQIQASDVNGDGLTLTVVDFVRLIKILIGDSIPVPNINPIFVNGKYFMQMNRDINILNDLEISAAHIVLEGNITPTLLADSMTMIYNYDGTNTNILIYSLENHYFTGSMINIGDGQIVSINMVDLNGSRVELNAWPSTYTLAQNYPNPFKTITYIDFTLPLLSDVTFEVRNINSEIVFHSTQAYNIGIHQIVFDGSELASGTYSYRLRAGYYDYSRTMDIVR